MQANDYARVQANGLDNIAPTPQQAAAVSQYAVTDDFLSAEEQAAVLKQINIEHPGLQKKLDEVGITREFFTANPDVERALFAGQPTSVLTLQLPNNLQLQGKLRIAITEEGPQLRVTPVCSELTIPDKVGDIQLNQQERQELEKKGFVEQVIHMPKEGGFLAGFWRVDSETNTVNIWRVNPQTLPSNLLGIDLTRDQQIALATGHPIKLSGLKDRQGEPFDATVSLSVEKRGLRFSDVGRPDMVIKPEEKHRNQLAQNNEGAKTDQTRGLEEKTGHKVATNAQTETIKRLMDPEAPIPQHTKKLTP